MPVGDPDEKILVWCSQCSLYFSVRRDRYRGVCTKCGNMTRQFRCTRCGYMWTPKDPRILPGTCAKCASPYAFSKRVKQIPREKMAKQVTSQDRGGVDGIEDIIVKKD